MQDIKELDSGGIETLVLSLGMPRYRAQQILDWVYKKRARNIDEMTNLSRADRDALRERAFIGNPEVLEVQRGSDGTAKFLLAMRDSHQVEAVIIPDDDRLTLCVSSQVGCAFACRFCLTGGGGIVRNLTAGEIVSQVMTAETLLEPGQRLTNIVFMGMGEPLSNFEQVSEALRRLTDPEWLGISGRRITVSTVGLVPGIRRLAASGLKVKLAVSLNATTDEVRNVLMPINRSYPIKALLDACREYPLTPRERITFEYVMLRGVNDSLEDAARLTRLLKGIPCKVNLIPFNEFPGSCYRRPDNAVVAQFQDILAGKGFIVLVRRSKGADISAACGQLRADRQKGHLS